VSCPEFEPLLDAYLDGELPVPEVLKTESHLSECEKCRARYESLQGLRVEIKAARLAYSPPASLRSKVQKAAARSGETRRSWFWGAGMAAAAAGLAALLLVPRVWVEPERVGQEVLDSHLRSLAAANLVDVPGSDRHTVKPWFQGKLGFSPNVPDLAPDGFPLVGGRVEVIHQQRAAAIVYKRREHVINVFIAESRTAAPGGTAKAQGYNMISWGDGELSYWAVSDLDAAELFSFTQLLRKK
jgi:anti-sigma factor RsiW